MKNQLQNENADSPLLSDIVQKFGVSEEFVKLYKQHYPARDWQKPTWDKFIASLSSLDQLHTSYAMSTVIRGRNAYNLLTQYGCINSKKRYLDIGTAYAGFLRAFKEQGFEEVVGIELKEYLANFGRANINGLDGAQILLGNFVSDDFSSLGLFDIITCNDVIEHVDDPALTMQKLAGMVSEGGCLSLEVPNKDYIDFVKSDGHFQIFGITQLPRELAADYYAAVMTGYDRENYLFEMGEMYELEWYIKQLAEHGMNVFIADTHKYQTLEQVPALVKDLRDAYDLWRRDTSPKLGPGMADVIIHAVDNYIQKLEHDFSRAKNDPTTLKKFEDKYLRSFWTICAIKEPLPVGQVFSHVEEKTATSKKISLFQRLGRRIKSLARKFWG